MNHSAAHTSVAKHRIEALADGVYAIALTLLVLELKLPPLPAVATDRLLLQALAELTPKALTWLLSFWVMATFWLAQARMSRLTAAPDRRMVWLELLQLALISLLPFSTALMGERGDLATAAALYSGHLLLLALVSYWRTAHLLARPELQAPEFEPGMRRPLLARLRIFVGCCIAAIVLAFFYPGWNMLALLPMAALPRLLRL